MKNINTLHRSSANHVAQMQLLSLKKAGPAKKTHRLQFDSSNALAPYRGWDGGNSLYIT